MTEFVSKDVCTEKHKATDEKDRITENRLNDHSGRIKSVEQAVLILTEMVKSQQKKDVFDKILIISVFIMCIIIASIVLGPDITGKILGGAK